MATWQEEARKPPDISNYMRLLRANIRRLDRIIRACEKGARNKRSRYPSRY
jgi:hypothetical protein